MIYRCPHCGKTYTDKGKHPFTSERHMRMHAVQCAANPDRCVRPVGGRAIDARRTHNVTPEPAPAASAPIIIPPVTTTDGAHVCACGRAFSSILLWRQHCYSPDGSPVCRATYAAWDLAERQARRTAGQTPAAESSPTTALSASGGKLEGERL